MAGGDRKPNCIVVEKLKDGYLYRIEARNANHGIWIAERGTFLISRVKFGNIYLFEEVHYDLDEHFGTAQPLEEMEKAPFPVERLNGIRRSDKEVLEYLIAKEGIDPTKVKSPEFYL